MPATERVAATPTQAQACIAGEGADGLPYQFNAVVHFVGALDPDALQRALTGLVTRHEILRTRFPEHGGTWWQVVEAPFAVALPVSDLRRAPDPEAARRRIVADAFAERLRIDRLPLARWRLVRTADDHWTLVHVEHHLVHDGWSWSIFLRELAGLYRIETGTGTPLPDVGWQFRDFARWQEHVIEGPAGREQLEHWCTRLARLPEPLALPADRPRPSQPTYRGDQLVHVVAGDVVDELQALGRRAGATLFMTMLSAFVVMLHRASGQDDIVVGSGVANRRAPGADDVLGMLLNTVALRTDLSDDPTFSELLARVRDVTLDAFAHQDVPFPLVVEAVAPERRAGVAPVYQVLFSFQDPPPPDLTIPDLVMSPDDSPGNHSAKADLNVVAVRDRSQGGAVTIIWEYSTDLFDRDTAARLLDSYRVLLDTVTRAPDLRCSEFPLVTDEALAHVHALAGRALPYERDASIVDVVRARALEQPDAAALVTGDATVVSYGELDRRTNQLARRLAAFGIAPGSTVGVFLERAPLAIETLLAILKTGAAYVGLDPGWPAPRLQELLTDTGAVAVCTERHVVDRLPEGTPALRVDLLDCSDESDAPLDVVVEPLAVAYLAYTSGSSGRPKCVEVPHRAVVRLVRSADYVELGPEETLLALAPLAFDASTFEIWGALCNGARLAVAPPNPQGPADVGELLRRHGVTTLWLTAGLFHQMVDLAGDDLRGVRQLLAGGDVLSPHHVTRALQLIRPDGALVNGYGPTEATTFTCCHRMPARTIAPDPVPIGRAVPNSYVYVLDDHGLPVAPGATGELHVAGDGLALRYRDRADESAERFVTPRFGGVPGGRLYRTGDLARMDGEGVVEFLGRLDRQVKLRGFRVEPEAVEHLLLAHPAVRQAVVEPCASGPDGLQLAAYVVAADSSFSIDDVRGALSQRLPTHEVPSYWVVLDALPLTPNGKVDRQALPAPGPRPDDDTPVRRAERVEPDALERQMLGIWEDVLAIAPVRLDDDFFDLGGHSLLAVELFARVEQDIGPRLPLATIFEAPTPHDLVAALRAEGWAAPWDPIVVLNADGDRVPFFCCSAGDGNTVGYGALARHLPADQPFYGLQPSGLDGRTLLRVSVESMARRFVRAVRAVRPHGPYLLGGRCLGGLVAYEMARRLEADGEEVALVAVLDSLGPHWAPRELAPGIPFDEVMNLARQRARADGDDPGDVFSANGAAHFLGWLREPLVAGQTAGVNRYLREAYLARPDVQAAYPDLTGDDAAGVIGWAWNTGREEMGLVASLLPPGPPVATRRPDRRDRVRRSLLRARERSLDHLDVILRGRAQRFRSRRLRRLQEVAVEAALAYRAGPYGGPVTVLRTEEFLGNVDIERWHGVAATIRERMVFGSHRSMLREPDVASLATTLQECIDDALAADGSGRVASGFATDDDR